MKEQLSSVNDKTALCIKSYSRLKNLKLVSKEIDMPWQTVYWHLKKANIAVSGDKSRYGAETDKLARQAEIIFRDTVPLAKDMNETEFQSKFDFLIGNSKVDIKASKLKSAGRQKNGKIYSSKWAFGISKQKKYADYYVLYCMNKDGTDVVHIILLPKEIANVKTSISIPVTMNSRWSDYKVSERELVEFFRLIHEDAA